MADEAYRQNESAIDMDACARPLADALSDARERGRARRMSLPAMRPADRDSGEHPRTAAAEGQAVNVEA